MQLFVSWSLSVYTLNQVACFMQSLFTNCSRQNGESWQWRQYHPCLHFANCCWNSAIQRDISHNSISCSYKWRRLSICSFDQITSLLFSPFQPCFIYHVLLFVDDVVTSWPQTKISDWSETKCIVILAVQNRTCSIPKCVSSNF